MDGEHGPIPHACTDPVTHTGPYRTVGPYEWDEMWNMDEEGWLYSAARGTRWVNPETGEVRMISGDDLRQFLADPLGFRPQPSA